MSNGAQQTPDGTAWEIAGPDGAPVMALIHGLGLCRGLWAPLMPALAARWRVLAYDLPGHGDSAPAAGEVTLGTFSDQLARVMDAAGVERAAVVGFSIGGMINRRFALDHPGRVGALAILNSPHERTPEAQAAVEARARAAGDSTLATMEAALERWFTPAFRAARPEVMAQLRHWRASADPAGYAAAAWVLAHGVRELVRPAPPIAAPTLVMTCEHDSGSTPDMARAIAAEIAGAELRIVPALRHLGLLEDPDAFTAPLLGFLDRQG